MMMKRLAIAVLAALVLATMPGAAFAQEDPVTAARPAAGASPIADRPATEAEWVEKVKTWALEAIEKRLVTLAELEIAIDTSTTVQANHAAKLMQDIRFSVKGLEDLAGEIRGATDLDTLRALVPQIFEDYRVYAIVVPKSHLTLGADAAAAVADRLAEVAGHIDDILGRLEEAGFEIEEARRLLAEMVDLVESGAASARAVPDMVLDLEPADYPDSTGILRAAHRTLKEGGSDLRSARDNAHEIARIIKDLIGGDED
jgi:hypothetical protein